MSLTAFDLRRRLWTRVGLVSRARQAAMSVCQAAIAYLGHEPHPPPSTMVPSTTSEQEVIVEHPTVATALANLSESLEKAGLIDDALCTGIRALAIRVKVG